MTVRSSPVAALVVAGIALGAPCVHAAPGVDLHARAARVGVSAPAEAPPADPPPEDGGFSIEEEAPEESDEDVETVQPEEAPPEPKDNKEKKKPPPDEGAWSFEVEDLTEDEAALEKELKAEKVEVKGAKGTVTGVLKDSVSGEPLVGADVEAVGTKYKTKTGLDGSYALDLPPGTYEIRLRYDTSQPLRVANVTVADGTRETVSRDLVPLAGETVKVEAEMNRESEGARLAQRKDSVAARDLMSRDEISKSGGGSTSSVARRIVGATVIDGRYLFIRGLGHRYGNTLFDGARVPSPDPERRTVPLDIFPSAALSAINIQKTFTPDVPADFTGGSTQLESREVPDKVVLELGADVGGNTATTFRDYLTNGPFPAYDAFGFGNLPRALPGVLPRDQIVQRNAFDDDFNRIHTDQEIERYGEAMYTDTRVRRADSAPPNFGMQATAGWGKAVGPKGGRFGFLLSAQYKNEHQTLREQIRVFGAPDGAVDTSSPQVDYGAQSRKTTNSTAWSTVGLVKGRITRDHRLALLGFYSRDADDETRFLFGPVASVDGLDRPVINTRLRYVMRSILMTRLGGEHTFPRANKLKIDWFGSYAQARRDDPAMREMVFSDRQQNGVFTIDPTNGGGKQLFLDLTDHTESGAANLTVPFAQWKKLESKFKTGVWIEGKQRDFFARRFSYRAINGVPLPGGTDNIINDATIGGGSPTDPSQVFFLEEQTRPNDNYRASQEIYATYAMLDLPIVRWFNVAGGARFEASRIEVAPYDLFDPDPAVPAEPVRLDDNDVLPALFFTFKPTSKMNLRLSGTRTLARPEFRELAPFEFQDYVGGFAVKGNTGLISTHVWNADLRWEWFPSASEVLAASLFYKWFDDPIERVALPRPDGFASFRNAFGAQNVGVELEARKNLEFIGRAFKNLSVGGNFAYIFSRVRLRGRCDPETDPTCLPDSPEAIDVSTSRERPLQGQSPWVANVYIDYDNKTSGTELRLLYNAFGRRIDQVMGLGAPDIYEEARHQFDTVFGQRLYKELKMQLAIENIANWPVRFTQGPDRAITYLAWPGATIKLGVKWSF